MRTCTGIVWYIKPDCRCLTASKVKKKGSINFSMKRYDGRTKPKPRDPSKAPPAPTEYSCLVRASYDKRKISTHVAHKDLNRFQIAFSALMRSGMSNIGKKPVQTVPTASAAPVIAPAQVPNPVTTTASSPSTSTTAKTKGTKKA